MVRVRYCLLTEKLVSVNIIKNEHNFYEFAMLPELFLGVSIVFLVLFGSYVCNYPKRPLVQKVVTKLCIIVLFLTLSLVINDFVFYYSQCQCFSSKIIMDELSFLVKIMILVFSIVYLLIIQQSLSDQRINSFEYPIIVLFAILGLLLLSSSNDLVTAYLSIELQSLSFYILASFKKTSGYSLNAGLKYFLIGALSSSLFLLGSSLVYGVTGSTNFEVFYYMFSFFSGNINSVDLDYLSSFGILASFDVGWWMEYGSIDFIGTELCVALENGYYQLIRIAKDLDKFTNFSVGNILEMDEDLVNKYLGGIVTYKYIAEIKAHSDEFTFIQYFINSVAFPLYYFLISFYYLGDYHIPFTCLVDLLMYFDLLHEYGLSIREFCPVEAIMLACVNEGCVVNKNIPSEIDGILNLYTFFLLTPIDNIFLITYIVDWVNEELLSFLATLELNVLIFLEALLERNSFDLCEVIEKSYLKPAEFHAVRLALINLAIRTEYNLTLSVPSFMHLQSSMAIPLEYGALPQLLREKSCLHFSLIDEYRIVHFAVLFIFISLCLKLAVAPFHLWSPDVYENSPTVSTVFFSTLPKLGIFTLFVRLFYHSFYGMFDEFRPYFIAVSVISIIIGSFAGLEQRKLKSLMIYSSIGHTGYLMLAFSIGTGGGLSMAIAYLIIYMCSSLCIWSIFLFTRLKHSYKKLNKDLTDLVLLRKSNPTLAFCFSIVLFSFAGFPPMVGFLTKVGVFSSTVGASVYYFSVISVLCSVVSTFYYVRLVKIMYFENVKVGKLYHPIKTSRVFIISLFTYLLIFLFVNPSVLYLIVIYISMGWNF